jgi:hypothetical protein
MTRRVSRSKVLASIGRDSASARTFASVSATTMIRRPAPMSRALSWAARMSLTVGDACDHFDRDAQGIGHEQDVHGSKISRHGNRCLESDAERSAETRNKGGDVPHLGRVADPTADGEQPHPQPEPDGRSMNGKLLGRELPRRSELPPRNLRR